MRLTSSSWPGTAPRLYSSLSEVLIHQRLDGAAAFAGGARPVLVAPELRVTDGDAAERLAYDVGWRRVAVAAESETGLRREIGVAPAVQDYTGDVPGRVESSCVNRS